MRELYNKIEEQLNTIKFENLWPDFKKDEFVLYNDTRAYFKDKTVGKPREFYGNTSAKYQGKNVAIWYIDSKEKIDSIPRLTSKIVHEMFHAFQMDNDEQRFANEVDGVLYPYNEKNIQLRYEEIKKLISIFDNFSKKEFKEFIRLRLERKELIGKYFDFETKVEVIEGLATYVELKALKMIDENEYELSINEIKERLKDISFQLNIRESLYYTGALLCLTLDKNKIKYDHKIKEMNKTIFDMIKGYNKPSYSSYNDDHVREELTKFITKKGEEVIKNLQELEACSCDNMKLIGFDPLNTISFNEYIFARRFLVIEENGKEKFLFGRFVFQLNEDRMITKFYKKEE